MGDKKTLDITVEIERAVAVLKMIRGYLVENAVLPPALLRRVLC